MPFLGKTPTKFLDANVNIDGGNIDGTTIGAASAASATVTTFTSTGIDDNATSTAITIDSSENVLINNTSFGSLGQVVIQQSADNKGIGIVDSTASNTFTVENNAASCKFHINTAKAITFSNGSGDIERMRIDSSGNVGIGTSSPSLALGTGLHIDSSGYTTINLQKGGAGQGHCIDFTDASNAIQYRIGTNFASGGENLLFAYGSTPTVGMTLNSSGNVGIGTTSPTFSTGSGLEIQRTSATATLRLEYTGANGYELSAESGQVTYNSVSSLPHVFEVGSTERMRIDSSGKVGIGTTSPDQTLHVHKGSAGTVASQANSVLTLENNTSAILQFLTPNTADQQVRFGDPQDNGAGYINYSHAASALTFGVNGPERMRIDSSGNVGIGETAPLYKLDINGATTSGIVDVAAFTNPVNAAGTGHGARILLHATQNAGRGVAIASSSNVNYATDNDMLFYTSASSTLTERMRIDSSGNVLIHGTTRLASSILCIDGSGETANAVAAKVDNNVYWNYVGINSSGTNSFYVYGDGDVENTNNSYGAISDERLKSNIVDASSQIDDIMAVQVRNYTLNETGDTHIGVVAQELEASGMSGLVKTNDEGMKSVKYSILYMKAIKALQEAVTRIETLEAEVAALKGA